MIFFFFFLNKFIYLFLAVLGLRFCVRAFSSCGKRGPLFIAVRGSLTIAASLVAEHRLQTRRLSSCGSRAQLLHGLWDLPRPGLEPVSPALAGRFSTTAPPGKPWKSVFLKISIGGLNEHRWLKAIVLSRMFVLWCNWHIWAMREWGIWTTGQWGPGWEEAGEAGWWVGGARSWEIG